MGFHVVRRDEFDWLDGPHEPGEPVRFTSGLSERVGLAHVRANIWRWDPGAKGIRHRHPIQEETFVVLSGTLTMYLGDPPERVDVPAGGIVHVDPGMAQQTVNHGDEELVVYAHGWPRESERPEGLDSAV